jgi:hypothetical protein
MSTCAIVGNSPIVLDSKNGSFIDSHDKVIRFNIAKTAGYEKFVGTKTTDRYCNLHPILCALSKSHLSEHTKYFPEWDNDFIYTWKDLGLHLKDVGAALEGTDLQRHFEMNGVSIFNIEPMLLQSVRRVLNSEPTMGIIAIIESLSQSHGEINCFGFDFYERPGSTHYFEKVLPYNTCHNSSGERSFINELSQQGRIKLYR